MHTNAKHAELLERFYTSALDALKDHVAIIDALGAVVLVNDAWRTFSVENGMTAITTESAPTT